MLCVIAKLPPEATEKLNALVKAVKPSARLHGHITIATYLPEDDRAFMDACEEMLREYGPFTVRYGKIEVLSKTSIIVATPSRANELVSLHSRISGSFGESLDQWTRGEDWYPHTTLLYDPTADLNALCAEMQKHFSPFETQISQIEFSKVEEKEYTILKTIELNP